MKIILSVCFRIPLNFIKAVFAKFEIEENTQI